MLERDDILGKTSTEIRQVVETLKLPGYTALQISNWLYKKKAESFDQMTDLSRDCRKQLHDLFFIGLCRPSAVQVSSDEYPEISVSG